LRKKKKKKKKKTNIHQPTQPNVNPTAFTTKQPDARKGGRVGDTRTLKLRVDPAQYHLDMKTSNDVYSADCLNILVRRKAKENNFKAVLETVRDLMATDAVGQVS